MLPRAWFHCVADLTSMYIFHIMSGLKRLAKYIHLNTLCAHLGAKSFVLLESFWVIWWASMLGVSASIKWWRAFARKNHNIVRRIFDMKFHVVSPLRHRLREFVSCVLLVRHFSGGSSELIFLGLSCFKRNFCFSLSATQKNLTQSRITSSRSTSFSRLVHRGSFFSIPTNFWRRPHLHKNYGTSANLFPQCNPCKRMTIEVLLERNTDSSMVSQCFGLRLGDSLIHICGHSCLVSSASQELPTCVVVVVCLSCRSWKSKARIQNFSAACLRICCALLGECCSVFVVVLFFVRQSTTLLLYIWRCLANSACFKWQRSRTDANKTGLPSFFAGRISSACGFTCITSQVGKFLELSHSCAALRSGMCSASLMEMVLCTRPLWNSDTYLFSAIWCICFWCACPSCPQQLLNNVASGFLGQQNIGTAASFPDHPSLWTQGIARVLLELLRSPWGGIFFGWNTEE